MFRKFLFLLVLLGVLLIAPAAKATSLIPQCDYPTKPIIYPDGSYDCVMQDGSQPPPELGGPPTPEPTPPPPAPTISPDDAFGDAYQEASWAETTQTWSTLATSPAGCKTAHKSHEAKSWYLSTLVIQYLEVRYCYQGGNVYGATATCYTSNVRWTIQPQGCPVTTSYFTWNGRSKGGLNVVAIGTYKNCVGSLCASDRVITLRMNVYGNGNWD